MAPVRRTALTIKKKIQILNAVDRGNISKSEIARQFAIAKSTLFTILKDRNKIQNVKNVLGPKRIRVREAKYPNLEKALVKWLRQMISKNITIDRRLLKAKAKKFARRMDVKDFKYSDGWMQKFKSRHGLIFRKVCEESASVDVDENREGKEKCLRELIAAYPSNDIFNADETGLFYKLLPDRSLAFKGETCSGGKKAKQRITLLLAANMTGTEKLPLLVIGKYQKPWCFKGMKTLPTTYRANNKAWMTAIIYEEWLKDLDRKMSRKNRKILLFVENCAPHCEVDNLKSIRVEFLPPDMTSVLQPMDQGVVQCFKLHYRKMLLNRIILCQENQEYEIDILRAMYLCHSAWKEVDGEIIANCFRLAGFVADPCSNQVPSEPFISEDRDLERIMKQVNHQLNISDVSLKDYSEVDSNLQCFQVFREEEIITKIIKAETSSNDEDEEEDPISLSEVSLNEAHEALEKVGRFFRSKPTCEDELASVMKLQTSLLWCQPKRLSTDFGLPDNQECILPDPSPAQLKMPKEEPPDTYEHEDSSISMNTTLPNVPQYTDWMKIETE